MIKGQTQCHDAVSESHVRCDGIRWSVYAAEAEDGRFGKVDDRRESVDAERAEVRDRERAALQLLIREATSVGLLDELTRLTGDVEDGLAIDVTHDGDQQAVRRIDRDANMNVIEDGDRAVSPASVQRLVLVQRVRNEFGEAISDRWDDRCTRAFELFTKFDDRRDVDFSSERNGGGLLQACDHAIGDGASQRCDWDCPSGER